MSDIDNNNFVKHRSLEDKNDYIRLMKEAGSTIRNVQVQFPGYGTISIIREEFTKLTDGVITANQAAENIYDRLWLYYNE